jgi:DNA-binding PadR family transcriptional regulator
LATTSLQVGDNVRWFFTASPTSSPFEQGTLYPLLKRLETQGFLISEWRQEGGRQKRYYRLSSAGLRLFELLQREWREIGRTINAIVDGPQSRAA